MPSENTDDILLVQTIHDNLKKSADFLGNWRDEAEENDAFVAGHQWEKEDRDSLKEHGKPSITYNRIEPMVNAVVGTEITHRQKMIFIPRDPTNEQSSGASDLATEGCTWALDQCGGEYERTLAFRDMVTRGIGWVHYRMDYEEDLDGSFVLSKVDGMDMYFDPDSRAQNLSDATWVARARVMQMGEAEKLWPDKVAEIKALGQGQTESSIFGAGSGIQPTRITNPVPNSPVGLTYSNYTPGGVGQTTTEVPGVASYGTQKVNVPERSPHNRGYINIIEYQWYERHTVYRVIDKNDNISTLSDEEYKKLKKRLKKIDEEVNVVKQHKRKYHRAFVCGNVLLQRDDSPFEKFTYQAMTCSWDPKEKYWYGIVRAMKDPQRGANKYFSLGVHLFSVSPKGTMLAESGAFINPSKASRDWSRPGSIINLKPGALSQSMVKVEPPPAFPQAATTMIQYSIESLRDVTGINMEMMGQTDGPEAGTSIQKKQTQGLTILAPLFNSYARYRETEARIVLDFMRKFLTDGRWIRIGGPYNSQYLQLVKDDLADSYDLMLDDAPTDPNQKMAVWENLQPLLPMLVRQGTFPIALLDYAPLPASVTSAIKREIENMAQQGQQQQEPVSKNEDPSFIQAEIALKNAQAELASARAKSLLKESDMDVATQAQTLVLRDEDAEIQRRIGDDNSADQVAGLGKMQSPKNPGIKGAA
jgi:hypothetical protein